MKRRCTDRRGTFNYYGDVWDCEELQDVRGILLSKLSLGGIHSYDPALLDLR